MVQTRYRSKQWGREWIFHWLRQKFIVLVIFIFLRNKMTSHLLWTYWLEWGLSPPCPQDQPTLCLLGASTSCWIVSEENILNCVNFPLFYVIVFDNKTISIFFRPLRFSSLFWFHILGHSLRELGTTPVKFLEMKVSWKCLAGSLFSVCVSFYFSAEVLLSKQRNSPTSVTSPQWGQYRGSNFENIPSRESVVWSFPIS